MLMYFRKEDYGDGLAFNSNAVITEFGILLSFRDFPGNCLSQHQAHCDDVVCQNFVRAIL